MRGLLVLATAVLVSLGLCALAAADAPSAAPEETAAVSAEDAPAAATAEEEEVEEEAIPEIAVEVVGKREGLLSISPAPGEALVEVEAEEIEAQGAEYVMDAIDITPSVFIRHQGARYENRLSIRGAAPRLVLLDGIPIAREGYTGLGGGAGGKEAGFAGRILYTLPASVIERIDVIRSVGTIVYGPASATGAVINIVTKDPEEGQRVTVGSKLGSFQRTRHDISSQVSDGRLGFFVHGGLDYAQSHLPLGEKRFADTFTKLVYEQPDGSTLLIDYFSLDGRRTIDLSQDFSIVPPRYWNIDPWRERFANVVYSKALSEEETLDFVVYQRDRDFATRLYTNDTFSVVRQRWIEGEDDQGADLRYSVRRENGRMTRTGLQWAKISSDMVQTTYIGPGGPFPVPRVFRVDQDRVTKSLFYNDTVPLGAKKRVSLGVRYDDPTDADAAFTYSAGLEADLSPRTSWHIHAGTGQEHPTPTDGDILNDIVPPEAQTLAAETGWVIRPDDRSRAAVNVFWSDTEDARILYNDPPGAIGPTAWLSKAEDLTQWGVELTYDRQVRENLNWFVNYTYLREDFTNENEPSIPGPDYPTAPEPPAHIAAAGVRTEAGGTRIAVTGKYSGDYMALNRLMETAAPVDSYVVFDVKASRTVGDGKVSLLIENILGSDYETMPAFPRPGRSYLASYELTF